MAGTGGRSSSPRPAPQSGQSRGRTSTRVPIAGTQPGRDRAGTGDPDCCAGEDSLAGAAAPESIRQRHSQDGCTGRRLARLSTGLPSSLRSPARCAWAVLSLLLLTGCGGPAVNGPGQGNPSPLTVTSPDLAGGTFPREFTCDGANRPPRLQWSTPPSGTQELAVQMPGPDAPGGTFTHWLIYRMPPGITSQAAVPPGAAEGVNDFGRRGHGGPRPPRVITTSWSSHWPPGWAWQPERGGRIWTPASAVTCWAGANWSPPTGAPERPCQRQRARFGQQKRGPSLSTDTDHRVQSTSLSPRSYPDPYGSPRPDVS